MTGKYTVCRRVHALTFQPGNLTGCGSEGVKGWTEFVSRQDGVEPAQLGPSISGHRRYAPLTFKISGKQGHLKDGTEGGVTTCILLLLTPFRSVHSAFCACLAEYILSRRRGGWATILVGLAFDSKVVTSCVPGVPLVPVL